MLQYYFNPRVSRCLIQVSSQHQISNCYEVNFFTTSRAEVKIGLLQQNDIFYPPGGYIVPFGGGGGGGCGKGMWKPPSQRDFNQSNFFFVLIYAPACIIPSSMVDIVPHGHLLQKAYNYVMLMIHEKMCGVHCLVGYCTDRDMITPHFSH